jgi:hypothetical protein
LVQTGLKGPLRFLARHRAIFNNPVWYVVTVALVAGIVSYFRFWWWVAGLVALLWGAWLMWHARSGSSGQAKSRGYLLTYSDLAQTYGRRIDQLLSVSSGRSRRRQQQELSRKVELWVEAIQTVVRRLDQLYRDELLESEMVQVPLAIEDLKRRLSCESNDNLRPHLQRTLLGRQTQIASLNQLQTIARQAEVRIEHTLSLLGTIHSQLLVGESSNQVANYERLCADVDEEVNCLQDHLEAIREVKQGLPAPS